MTDPDPDHVHRAIADAVSAILRIPGAVLLGAGVAAGDVVNGVANAAKTGAIAGAKADNPEADK